MASSEASSRSTSCHKDLTLEVKRESGDVLLPYRAGDRARGRSRRANDNRRGLVGTVRVTADELANEAREEPRVPLEITVVTIFRSSSPRRSR